MYRQSHYIVFIFCILFFMLCLACRKTKSNSPVLFAVLEADRTGLHFTNKLTPTAQFNMFNYMYFYNGAGVGAGDFNNDGLVDLFFASNQGDNKLFLNKGELHFKDVTDETTIPQDHGWSTGVSVVDINDDGLLDIYVCKVGQYKMLKGKNQLLVCKGIRNNIPFYKDEAQQYGLDFSGFSTQAVFFDYDRDDDLDMFLLNHAVHQNGSFAARHSFSGTYDSLAGDRLYRNDDSLFTDVTRQSGINSSAIGYGLGIAVADINLDGWPDLYVGNDFHENDYLYINRKNGTFSDEGEQRLMHTSQFSMGVDVADANNDGYPEIISVDMLPSDPFILKRSLGDNDYDVFYQKISAGYSFQYPRNNLQFSRRNGMFSETGIYAGIYATDWSWAPLWMDFDNDGLKDLFISNGIPKRLNDIDYINFIYSDEMQEKLNGDKLKDKDMALTGRFPEIKIPNKFYSNVGELKFRDKEDAIRNDRPTYSNGAVYADFDNDGDLDIAVNNIDDPALVYENKTNDKNDKVFATVKLNGPVKNRNAVGSKIFVFTGNGIRAYEKTAVKGFMSGMEIPLHIGLAGARVDSAFLVWPDNSFQRIRLPAGQPQVSFTYQKGLPQFNYHTIASYRVNETKVMEDITAKTGLNYLHRENSFNEFNRESLLPHMISSEGPALAVADINHDGLEDVFIGASKTFHNAVFLQQPGGRFLKTGQPELLKDSMYEDVDAVWTDINNDGNTDLLLATGGNEYYGNDKHLLPRAFLNNGKGQLTKSEQAFSNIYVTASCIVPYDFNNDGYADLFIGGRCLPWEYGSTPSSFLLQNDGTGKFSDVTPLYAKELSRAGMVTDAAWTDLDTDGDKDLVLCREWGGIDAYINTRGYFTRKELSSKKGWWNFVLPADIDKDGDIDLVAGNMGLNSRLHASDKEPVKFYFNDFDDNGRKEQVLTYFLDNKEIPFANKMELEKQLPFLKKKFLRAEAFARATPEQLFTGDKIKGATMLYADYFANAVLLNDGKADFTLKDLPWQAQLTSYRDAIIINANGDDLPDILLCGNYYDNNAQSGRYDSDFGTILVNKGAGNFTCESINGLVIKGQVRHARKISISGKDAFVLAKNSDSVRVIGYKGN